MKASGQLYGSIVLPAAMLIGLDGFGFGGGVWVHWLDGMVRFYLYGGSILSVVVALHVFETCLCVFVAKRIVYVCFFFSV